MPRKYSIIGSDMEKYGTQNCGNIFIVITISMKCCNENNFAKLEITNTNPIKIRII